jgi:hypothetical protein
MADLTTGNKGFTACAINLFPLATDCSYAIGDPIPQSAGLVELEMSWEREEANEVIGRTLGGGFCYNFTFPGFNKYMNIRIRLCSVCATTQALWFDAVAILDAAGDTVGLEHQIASESSSNFCSTTPSKKLALEVYQPIIKNTNACDAGTRTFRKHVFPLLQDVSSPAPMFSDEEVSYIELEAKGYSNGKYNKGPFGDSPSANGIGGNTAWGWYDLPDTFVLPTVADDCAAPVATAASL